MSRRSGLRHGHPAGSSFSSSAAMIAGSVPSGLSQLMMKLAKARVGAMLEQGHDFTELPHPREGRRRPRLSLGSFVRHGFCDLGRKLGRRRGELGPEQSKRLRLVVPDDGEECREGPGIGVHEQVRHQVRIIPGVIAEDAGDLDVLRLGSVLVPEEHHQRGRELPADRVAGRRSTGRGTRGSPRPGRPRRSSRGRPSDHSEGRRGPVPPPRAGAGHRPIASDSTSPQRRTASCRS